MTEEIALQGAFRLAMRHLASTVSIISVQSGSMRHGTTATSMTSLSMDPPSVLVCINKTSRLHMLLHKEDRFCVNILHTDNVQTSEVFSMPLPADERFCSGEWDTRDGEAPYLVNAQANLFCRKEKEIVYGSHTIFIGRVVSARTRPDSSPLLYHNGSHAACSLADDRTGLNSRPEIGSA
jgi:flavin reductase (DIM6/NTAB) family NADH-FMN oxidoreductase RutF